MANKPPTLSESSLWRLSLQLKKVGFNPVDAEQENGTNIGAITLYLS
jgi:hypothetical protein